MFYPCVWILGEVAAVATVTEVATEEEGSLATAMVVIEMDMVMGSMVTDSMPTVGTTMAHQAQVMTARVVPAVPTGWVRC